MIIYTKPYLKSLPPFVPKYTCSKYIRNKYTLDKYTRNKNSHNKYTRNKYSRNKHTRNKYSRNENTLMQSEIYVVLFFKFSRSLMDEQFLNILKIFITKVQNVIE